MRVILDPLEAENLFHTALCNGLGGFDYYGISVSYDEKDYDKAKESLKDTHASACYEDILLQILRNGGKLFIIDHEGEDEEIQKSITLADVHERVHNAPNAHLMNIIFERDDAITADVILQWVFFQEIIYA